MPELPEVETIVRTLSPQIVNASIKNVTVLNEGSLAVGQEYLNNLIGKKICTVVRRAKLLIVILKDSCKNFCYQSSTWDNCLFEPNSLYLAFHLKMTGKFFVYEKNTPPNTHTRIIFDLDNGGRLFFDDVRKFGYCRIMKDKDFNLWNFWKKLGPEPLLTPPNQLANILSKKNANIKSALLNQELIVGIGNIYADEALFKARIHPKSTASAIPLEKLEKLTTCIQQVLNQSIEECGSSIRDYRDANGDAGSFQNNFYVYGQGGKNCKICKKPLTTLKVAGRTTVCCHICQKIYQKHQ